MRAMPHTLSSPLALALLLVLVLLATRPTSAFILDLSGSTTSLPPSCPTLPTVPINPTTYFRGTWYQSAATAFAGRFAQGDNQCVTANYTTNPDRTVTVFNCDYVAPPEDRVDCATGSAYQPDDADAGKFLVSFFGFFKLPAWLGGEGGTVYLLPGGDYWVVAVWGEEEEGYDAAVVYGCEEIDGEEEVGINVFVISRTRVLKVDGLEGEEALEEVYRTLEQKGLDVRNLDFIVGEQPDSCRYFFDE